MTHVNANVFLIEKKLCIETVTKRCNYRKFPFYTQNYGIGCIREGEEKKVEDRYLTYRKKNEYIWLAWYILKCIPLNNLN